MLKIPTKFQLIQMLDFEEKIRLSPDYIKLCDEVADEANGWLRISEEIQYSIAKQFGFNDFSSHIAVNHMRRARYLYPEEPAFQTISVYVRNNLASECVYKLGDFVPNIQIYKLDLTSTNLFDTFDKTKLNVLVSSSHT